MFISAFSATSTNTGLTPSSGTGNVIGMGISVDNAIPKYIGGTGDTIEASGILISDVNDLIMLSTLENAIVMRRWGVVGVKTDPTFSHGRIIPNGSGQAIFRNMYSDSTGGERTLSELGSDGGLTLYSDYSSGQNLTLSQGTRVFPFGTFDSGAATGWYYHPSTVDQDAQAFAGLEGVSTFKIKTGPNKAALVARLNVSNSSINLTDSVTLDMTEFASHPSPPALGEISIYPLNTGTIFAQDDTGAITPLSPQPVVTHETSYKGNRTNGFLKNGDTYSNVARHQVPFDSDILSVSVDCSAPVNEWRVELIVNNNPIPAYTLTMLATDTEKNVELPGVILNKNQNYGIRIQKGVGGSGAGPNIPDPAVTIYLRKRA